MSQLNTNIIKGVQDNDDVVIKTNNTTRVTIASGGDVSLPTTTCTSLSAPSVSAVNTCKAWANFNGTGTPALRNSYNVSSITDNGTGDYTINWDTDFSSTDYAVYTFSRSELNDNYPRSLHGNNSGSKTAGSIRLVNATANAGALRDSSEMSIAAFDL